MSFAFDISRNTTASFVSGIKSGKIPKVGSYNASSPSHSDLMSSYRSLQKGDALVKSGHCFMVASVDFNNQRVYVYEQTPSISIATSHSFSSLANSGYMPFAKN